MKKLVKNILIIITVLLLIYGIGQYGYYKYISSLDFVLEEKLVVKFYKDDNKYLIDLNNYFKDKLYLDLEKSKYNLSYINDIKYVPNSLDINKGKIYKGNELYLDFSKYNSLINFFTKNDKYFIIYKPFKIKCIDCNYFVIFNLENKKYRKINLYDENNNLLIVESILGYNFK